MIALDDFVRSWHLVYFFHTRKCYLWTWRRLPGYQHPHDFSKNRFRVCVSYENLSDADINALFKRFYKFPIEINPNYCSFHLPGKGVNSEKGDKLEGGLKALIEERNRELDERIKRNGSRVLGLEPES